MAASSTYNFGDLYNSDYHQILFCKVANDIIIDNAGIIALMEVADMAAEKELNICRTQKS